jgi:hypothetical protein
VVAGGAVHVNVMRFDLHYDPLLVGCGLALLRFNSLRLFQSRYVPILAVAVIALMLSSFGDLKGVRAFKASVCYLAVAFVINYVVEHPVPILNYR